MSTVMPKLLHSRKEASQIPVWEIVTENGRRIYYERVYQEGYIPIGVRGTFQLAGTTALVCDLVRQDFRNPPVILKAKDGYVAPMSWYETEAKYNMREKSDNEH